MDKIIIGFSKPKNMRFKFFAWSIMKALGTPYSHVYIKIWSSKYNRFLYYQASGSAVNFMSEKYFAEHNQIVEEFEFEIDDITKTEMMQFAIDTCGAPYGIKQIIYMAYVRIGELLGKKWSSPVSDKQHTYVCSELASYVLEKFLGAHLPKIPDDMTPKDAYELTVQLASSIHRSASSQNAQSEI